MKSKVYTKEFFQESGKKGGTATAKRGKDFYRKIGQLGGKTRWSKKVAEIPPVIEKQ